MSSPQELLGKLVPCPYEDCTTPLDITLRSSDGIHFGAHKKNLEFFSEGFPPAEWTVEKTDEIVELPEKAIILRLLLRFMHNAALPRLSQECSDWNIDDLLAFIDTAEKYGVFIALQAGEEALRSRAEELSADKLLKVLFRKATRSDPGDIDVFARQSLRISMMVMLNFLDAHPRIFMIWCRYQLEWTKWKDEYECEMKMKRNHTLGSGRNTTREACTAFNNFMDIFYPVIRKIGGEFPELHHFEQAKDLLKPIPTMRICTICDPAWRGALMKLFTKQKRWIDCISVSGS